MCKYMCVTKNKEKDAIYSKESKERYMVEFGRRVGRENDISIL